MRVLIVDENAADAERAGEYLHAARSVGHPSGEALHG